MGKSTAAVPAAAQTGWNSTAGISISLTVSTTITDFVTLIYFSLFKLLVCDKCFAQEKKKKKRTPNSRDFLDRNSPGMSGMCRTTKEPFLFILLLMKTLFKEGSAPTVPEPPQDCLSLWDVTYQPKPRRVCLSDCCVLCFELPYRYRHDRPTGQAIFLSSFVPRFWADKSHTRLAALPTQFDC